MPRKRRKGRIWNKLLPAAAVLLIAWSLARFSLKTEYPEYPVPARSADVVVIGAGLAGPAAAVAAAEAGADVFYIDVSGPADSGFPSFSPFFWAAGTTYQQEAQIEYLPEEMAGQIMPADEEIQEMALRLCLASAESLAWLEERTATAFSRLADPQSRPGLHLPAAGRAERIVPVELQKLMGRLLAGNTRELRPLTLVFDKGVISGLQVRDLAGNDEVIFCRAVVLADGGIGGNPALVAARTGLLGVAARPDGGHSGVGMEIAAAAGALVTGLENVRTLPVLLPGGQLFSPALMPAARYLDSEGNAVPVIDRLATAVLAAGGRLFAVSGGEEEAADPGIVRVASLEDLALGLGLPAEKLQEALQGMEPPYRVAAVGVMAVTPGGIAVDEFFRVLSPAGPLPGLYAAGETVAGLPGIRPEEFSFAAGVISARLAAGEAASFARR
jgi:succinate dehydrogenase/fumarate reductase flavoprotein subunit